MDHVAAPAGAEILIREDNGQITRVPVIAFALVERMAYPITPLPTGGLLTARRALLVGGLIIDRGSPVPFADEDEWLAYCKTAKPRADEDGTFQMEARRGDEQVVATEPEEPEPEEPGAYTPPEEPETEASTPNPKAKKGKVFKNKTFWQRQLGSGLQEATECDGGLESPTADDGWEKIKREDFFALRRAAKSGGAVDIVSWPLGSEDPDAPAADDDFGGLI